MKDFEHLDPLMENARKMIAEHGWLGVGVMPTEKDKGTFPFTYTVGFTELNHPEVIVLGLPPAQAHHILHNVYSRIMDGEKFADGDKADEIITNFSVSFKALPPDGAPLNMARQYYDMEELPALQLLWPDAEGYFPDDARCNPKFAVAQDIEFARD